MILQCIAWTEGAAHSCFERTPWHQGKRRSTLRKWRCIWTSLASLEILSCCAHESAHVSKVWQDLSRHVFLELRQKTRVYSLACGYIARQKDVPTSACLTKAAFASSSSQVQSLRYSPELLSGTVDDDEVFAEASPIPCGSGRTVLGGLARSQRANRAPCHRSGPPLD